MTQPAAIATTPAGIKLLLPLCQAWDIPLWVPPSLPLLQDGSTHLQQYSGSLQDHLAQLWPNASALIFCLATGAVTRLIAPLLADKATDPAVVVVDPQGQYAISLCGGHQGGGDVLAQRVAQQLGGTPVITGAAAALNMPGVDVLGTPFGWRKGSGDWTAVSAAIARSQSPKAVSIVQTAGTTLWHSGLPEGHPFTLEPDAPQIAATVHITAAAPQPSDRPTVYWHPRVLWLGIGCERGTSTAVVTAAVEQALAQHSLSPLAVAGVTTLDLKADEAGLLAFCRDRRWPLRCYDAPTLAQVKVPHPSEVVAQAVGTPSVAEAAALQASGAVNLQVAKQVVRLDGEPGAATVAVAAAQQEYTGRSGQLWLVGTGPGALAQITPAAREAIAAADAVIGYG
ncbi:MAG: cobalamin biosynthesis protein, partial [Cyanobacteria bacterium P01_A01_bin.135]